MTNHGETTGSPESHGTAETTASGADISTAPASGEATGSSTRKKSGERDDCPEQAERVDSLAYDGHGDEQVTLRTPAELADALPYLLGYRPEDSIVLVALRDKDGRGRFGGRARLGIPANADDWPAVARQLAHGLVTGSERRGARPTRWSPTSARSRAGESPAGK